MRARGTRLHGLDNAVLRLLRDKDDARAGRSSAELGCE